MRLISVFLLSCLLLLGFVFIMVKYPNVNDSFSLLKYNDDDYEIINKYSVYKGQKLDIAIISNFSVLIDIQIVTVSDNESYVYHLNNYSINDPLNFTQYEQFKDEGAFLLLDIDIPTMVIISIKYDKELVYTAEALDTDKYPIFPIFLSTVKVNIVTNEVNSSDNVFILILITLLLFGVSFIHKKDVKKVYNSSTNLLRGDQSEGYHTLVIELIKMRVTKFEYRILVLILPYIFSFLWIIQDSESIIANGGVLILLYYSDNLQYQIGLTLSLLFIDFFIGIMDKDLLRLIWSFPIDRRVYFITGFVITTLISLVFINSYTLLNIIIFQYGIHNLPMNIVYTMKLILSNSITIVILQSIIYMNKLINTDQIQNYIVVIVFVLLLNQFKTISTLIFVNIRAENLLNKLFTAIIFLVIMLISTDKVHHMEVKNY